MAIMEDITPGNCWAFKEPGGTIAIKLSRKIRVTGISIDHPLAEAVRDPSSAPRHFTASALFLNTQEFPVGVSLRNVGKDRRAHELGRFEYIVDAGESTQTFSIQPALSIPTSAVLIEFQSNWGHGMFTCVYRVRVHGQEL